MNTSLLDPPRDLLTLAALALADPSPRRKFVALALGSLCGANPQTIPRALQWREQDPRDWSADDRRFSQAQWEAQAPCPPLFTPALGHPGGGAQRVYTGQDDPLRRKTGRKIPGGAWARGPRGPPFQVNLVPGRRFVQTALLLQPGGAAHPWRAPPVSFSHAPTPKLSKGASPQEQAAFKEGRKKHRPRLAAWEPLRFCRRHLDGQPGGRQRWLIDGVDGGYSNRPFFQGPPQRAAAVARVRKDAKLRAVLPPDPRVGARKYGPALPTPREHLRDPNLAWQSTEVFVANQVRTLQYKEARLRCWPKVPQTRPMRLILIQAAGDRWRKGSKLLYREPAFLITTGLATPAAEWSTAYLARWEGEVNFRDEKTPLGVGQAQVRNAQPVARAPAFLVAAHATLLGSNIRGFGGRRTGALARLPAWRRSEPARPSTRDLIRRLQQQAAQLDRKQMRN